MLIFESPSGAMISGIIYNYDGDIYASDEARMQAEVGHKEFRLGNLHTSTYEEVIGGDFILECFIYIHRHKCTKMFYLCIPSLLRSLPSRYHLYSK